MALVIQPLPPSSLMPTRVRRKPVPSIDGVGPVLAMDLVARYPAPDPADPFAPLSVLRTRSSTLQGRVETPVFPIQPPSLSSSSSSEDVREPLKPPVKLSLPQKESHYRRRSQSIAIFSASPTPIPVVIHSSLSSLVSEGTGNETDIDSGSLSPSSSASRRRSKMACIFLSKKPSNVSMGSEQQRRRKVSVASISSPLASPASTTDRTLSTRASLDSRHLPLRFDPGYYSQPETMPSFAFPASSRNVGNKRSALVSSFARPSTPMHSPLVPHSTPTARSDTSSYVNVSTPSHSYDDHDASIESSSFASHSFSYDRPPLPQQSPDEWTPPTPAQLDRAASLPLIAPSGLRVPFGTIFARERTVVIFIRHFWCPLCQDYMSSLASLTPRDANVVVISNGSASLIDKYKAIFGVAFDMYVDPGMNVYRALGMGTTRDMPHIPTKPRDTSLSSNAAGYVRRGTLGGIAMVVLRALRVGMPVWEKGGVIEQLGGEFVLGPGMKCTWAHRMQTPKGHAPVADVLEAGGIDIQPPVPPPRSKRRESMLLAMNGVRTSVSWSVEDKRKSMTIEEQWIRNGYMQRPKTRLVDDRENVNQVVEEEDEVVLFKE